MESEKDRTKKRIRKLEQKLVRAQKQVKIISSSLQKARANLADLERQESDKPSRKGGLTNYQRIALQELIFGEFDNRPMIQRAYTAGIHNKNAGGTMVDAFAAGLRKYWFHLIGENAPFADKKLFERIARDFPEKSPMDLFRIAREKFGFSGLSYAHRYNLGNLKGAGAAETEEDAADKGKDSLFPLNGLFYLRIVYLAFFHPAGVSLDSQALNRRMAEAEMETRLPPLFLLNIAFRFLRSAWANLHSGRECYCCREEIELCRSLFAAYPQAASLEEIWQESPVFSGQNEEADEEEIEEVLEIGRKVSKLLAV